VQGDSLRACLKSRSRRKKVHFFNCQTGHMCHSRRRTHFRNGLAVVWGIASTEESKNVGAPLLKNLEVVVDPGGVAELAQPARRFLGVLEG
jgi:hypothetical protein